jgi:YbbR domain-containing protein
MAGKNRSYKIFDISDKLTRTRMLLRALSLTFAVSLWLFVTWDGTATSVRNISVPLKYPDIQDGYSIANATATIEVTLEGRIENLALMDRNEVTASVAVHDLKPGKYRLPVQLDIPDGIRVASYSPQVVDIELFRIIERTLRPALTIVGETPPNLSLGNVGITPAEVVVRGPEPMILPIRRAEVKASADSLARGINEDLEVALVGEDGYVEGLVIEPSQVRVAAKLEEAVVQKQVPVRVSVEGKPSEGFNVGSVMLSPDMVTLRGRRSSLENVSEITLNDIDITGHYDIMDIAVPLDSPAADITIVSADRVNVTIEFSSVLEEMTFQGVPVKIDGNGVFEEWALNPSAVNVTLERTAATTEPFDMQAPPFELYVDVTNVVTRRMLLPVLVRGLSGDIRLLRIDPEWVTIRAVAR